MAEARSANGLLHSRRRGKPMPFLSSSLPTRAVRTARQVLADARGLTQPSLHQTVKRLPEVMQPVVSAHFRWPVNDPLPSAASTGGKAVRAALALLTCEAVNGDATAGMPAAVAV